MWGRSGRRRGEDLTGVWCGTRGLRIELCKTRRALSRLTPVTPVHVPDSLRGLSPFNFRLGSIIL